MLIALHILLGTPYTHTFPYSIPRATVNSFHRSLLQWMLLGITPTFSTLPSVIRGLTPPTLLHAFQGRCLTCPTASSILLSSPPTAPYLTPQLFTPTSPPK